MKTFLLSVAFMGYAFGAEPLVDLALKNNYEVKVLEEQYSALQKEVDLSTVWENPKLTLGVRDIYLDEPLTRNEAMQNEFLEFSQKIVTASKLDIKESIALQNLEIKALELHDKKLSLSKEVTTLLVQYARVVEDLKTIDAYQKVLEELKNVHMAYISTASGHFNQALGNTILEKNLEISKKTVLKEKQSLLYKLESLSNTAVNEPLHVSLEEGVYMPVNALESLRQKNPKLKIQAILSQRELNNLRYEKAQKTPDVTVGVGYARRQGRDDYAFLSFSAPLPIYGRENLSIQKAVLMQNASEQGVLALQNSLSFQLQDELLNKELVFEKISLSRESLEENKRIYESILATAFSQSDAMSRLLSTLSQSLELQMKLTMQRYLYNASIIQIKYLLGEAL